jgi:predicted O-methyltransferase YrrM
MKKIISNFLNILPYVRSLIQTVEVYKKGFPPGHFYSPVVDTRDVLYNKGRIFDPQKKLKAINMNSTGQIELLKDLVKYYKELPFSPKKKDGLKYYYDNNTYSYSDGIFLFLMIKEFKPKRIIEVGSGFSSSLMVDVNKLYFDNKIELDFIEPFPHHLNQAFENDLDGLNLTQKKVQEVSLDHFCRLEHNDILFIDSTHVSKTGSDVNYLFFEVLPALKKGVLIHIHDIFHPFEYPEEWVLDKSFHNNGFGWNEIYVLRTFLMYNESFEIILFNTFLQNEIPEWFQEHMPLCLMNKGGSIWLRKIK